MRVRLRDDPTPGELAELYPEPHDARRFGYGHGLRVAMTIQLAALRALGGRSIADLSCGNGDVVTGVNDLRQREGRRPLIAYMGDFAPGWPIHGPIEATIDQIPDVDVFVCSETIEHLTDPDAVLRAIRAKAQCLVLSTPIGETTRGNPEHLWGWDQAGVAEMLTDAGFDPAAGQRVDLILPPDQGYHYQVWAVS